MNILVRGALYPILWYITVIEACINSAYNAVVKILKSCDFSDYLPVFIQRPVVSLVHTLDRFYHTLNNYPVDIINGINNQLGKPPTGSRSSSKKQGTAFTLPPNRPTSRPLATRPSRPAPPRNTILSSNKATTHLVPITEVPSPINPKREEEEEATTAVSRPPPPSPPPPPPKQEEGDKIVAGGTTPGESEKRANILSIKEEASQEMPSPLPSDPLVSTRLKSSIDSAIVPTVKSLTEEIKDLKENLTEQVVTLEEQVQRMHTKMNKIEANNSNNSVVNNSGANNNLLQPVKTAEDIRAEIEEKTKRVADPSTPAEEVTALNVELEKLCNQLESTGQWQMEMANERIAKQKKSEPENSACLKNMQQKYTEANLASDPALLEYYEANPALKLINMDPADILKKHQNDWRSITTDRLTLEELRAIAANLPEFSNTQTAQNEWVDSLQEKIDKLASGDDGKPDRPILPTKTVVINTEGEVDGGKLFQELRLRHGEDPAQAM